MQLSQLPVTLTQNSLQTRCCCKCENIFHDIIKIRENQNFWLHLCPWPNGLDWTIQANKWKMLTFYDILTFPRSTVQARAILQHCSPSSSPSLSSTISWKLLHRLPTIFLSGSEFWSAWLAPFWALYVQQRSIIDELFLKFISFAILPFCRKPGEMDGWLLLSGLSTLLQQLHPQVSSSFIFGCFSPRWENNWWRSSSKLATHLPLHQITKRSNTLLP